MTVQKQPTLPGDCCFGTCCVCSSVHSCPFICSFDDSLASIEGFALIGTVTNMKMLRFMSIPLTVLRLSRMYPWGGEEARRGRAGWINCDCVWTIASPIGWTGGWVKRLLPLSARADTVWQSSPPHLPLSGKARRAGGRVLQWWELIVQLWRGIRRVYWQPEPIYQRINHNLRRKITLATE